MRKGPRKVKVYPKIKGVEELGKEGGRGERKSLKKRVFPEQVSLELRMVARCSTAWRT
jgi:hypothetical protein